MGEKRYIISDAAKLVEVESHVLRYWEEELSIEVPRNEMGHRYYTDFYIELFKKIKELKEGGFQLKAIKLLVPELMELEKKGNDSVDVLKEELFSRLTECQESDKEYVETEYGKSHGEIETHYAGDGMNNVEESAAVSVNTVRTSEITGSPADGGAMKNSKLEQFQTIITEVVSNALKENTGMLGREVSEIVSDNVIKEMDYLMHIREKQEEERFRKLDETIRSYQVSNREKSKLKKGIFSKIKRSNS